jgi:hypothetical protein
MVPIYYYNFQELVEFVRKYSPAGVPSPWGPTNTVLPPLVPTREMGEDKTTITVGDEDEEIVESGFVPLTSTPTVAVPARGSFFVRSTPRYQYSLPSALRRHFIRLYGKI